MCDTNYVNDDLDSLCAACDTVDNDKCPCLLIF